MNPVAAALAAVSFGPEARFENVTLIPLLWTHEPPPALDYLVLDEALAREDVEITEVSEAGSVPELRLLNRGGRPVLIVDGEELVGAKQNRVVNLSLLAPGDAELRIPVSCVEAGRWQARSRTFASAPRTQYNSGRARRVAQVTESLRSSGSRHGDQADVWAGISEKAARLDALSPTGAMEAIFVNHAASIDDFVKTLQPVDGQVGAIFAVNGAIVSLELFDRPATMARMLPKLVRSVAVDALDEPAASSPPPPGGGGEALTRTLASQFVALIAAASPHAVPAIGLGQDVRLTEPHVEGAALIANEAVIHLSAFPS